MFSKASLIQRVPSMLASALITSNRATQQASNQSDHSKLNLIFRIKPAILVLIRRVQRLWQVSSSSKCSPLPMTLRLQLSSKAEMSIYAPMSLNSALMVCFKKLRYMNYQCNVQISLFRSRDHFQAYEAALELSYLLERAKSVDTIDSSEENMIQYELQIRRFRSALLSVAGIFLRDHAELSRLIEKQLIEGNASNEMLVGIISSLAYLRYSATSRSNSLGSSSSAAAVSYLIEYEAADILSKLVFEFISLLERESSGRRYELVIYLLELLLSMSDRHNPMRKGKLYIRLAIDYAHINRPLAVEQVIAQAVDDPDVCYGDRLNLQRRQASAVEVKAPAASSVGSSRMMDMIDEQLFLNMIKQYHGTSTSGSQLVDLTAVDDDPVDRWTCTRCTLINESSAMLCEVCESPRPSSTSSTVSIRPTLKAAATADSDSQSVTKPKASKRRNSSTARASKDDVTAYDDLDADPSPEPATNTAIAEFTIISRRTSLSVSSSNPNYGKSKFYDSDDDLVHVEDLVMKKCYAYDSDDLEYSSFITAIDGGGWQGWHCEGSYIRSIYTLLFWEVIFYDQIPNTFLTAYQDHPLDLYYPTFYSSRAALIIEKVEAIARLEPMELVEVIGNAYRSYYRMECVSMSWYHALRHLQLIALCIGAKSLSYLCHEMSRSYRHYRSGAPDLLLLRVTRLVDHTYVNLADILGEDWQSTRRDKGLKNEEADAKNQAVTLEDPEPDALIDEDTNLSIASAADLTPESAPLAVVAVAKDKFLCEERDLQIPSSSKYENDDRVEEYKYESMFIEVKGPNDILADKQRIWLSTLTNAGLRAYVGHVKEIKLNSTKKAKAVVDS
jgi:hypothetical protein